MGLAQQGVHLVPLEVERRIVHAREGGDVGGVRRRRTERAFNLHVARRKERGGDGMESASVHTETKHSRNVYVTEICLRI